MAAERMSEQEQMEAALRPFGWEMGDEFWRRYHTDPWVFSLANAVTHLHRRVERLQAQLAEQED